MTTAGMTPQQMSAHLSLMHAIGQADDPIPCREDPIAWDGAHTGARGRGDLIDRWELAAYTCVSDAREQARRAQRVAELIEEAVDAFEATEGRS